MSDGIKDIPQPVSEMNPNTNPFLKELFPNAEGPIRQISTKTEGGKVFVGYKAELKSTGEQRSLTKYPLRDGIVAEIEATNDREDSFSLNVENMDPASINGAVDRVKRQLTNEDWRKFLKSERYNTWTSNPNNIHIEGWDLSTANKDLLAEQVGAFLEIADANLPENRPPESTRELEKVILALRREGQTRADAYEQKRQELQNKTSLSDFIKK